MGSQSARARMSEAMVRTVARDGYAAATIEQVVEKAGVSRAAFDAEFADKEACFLAGFDAIVDLFVGLVTAAYEEAAELPWAERIAAALGVLLELLAAEPALSRMAMLEVTTVSEEMGRRYRESLGRFVPFLEEGRETAGSPTELPAETARFAIAAATSMIFDEVRGGRAEELSRILPELTFAVVLPYLGAPGAEAEMRKVAAARGG